MVAKLLSPRLKTVMLAHISADNNFEELAFQTVTQIVSGEASGRGLECPKIVVADRYRNTDVFEI